jgi:hypothetical protein
MHEVRPQLATLPLQLAHSDDPARADGEVEPDMSAKPGDPALEVFGARMGLQGAGGRPSRLKVGRC